MLREPGTSLVCCPHDHSSNSLPASVARILQYPPTCSLALPLCLQALRFSPPLLRIADTLKSKIRALSSRYVAVHMRFEVDAVAYSMCNFGGNESEALKVAVPRAGVLPNEESLSSSGVQSEP